jgi:hypothetical protein
MKLLSNRLYTSQGYKTPCFSFLACQSHPPPPGDLDALLVPVENL